MTGAVAAVQLIAITALLFGFIGSVVTCLASGRVIRGASLLPPAVATARLRCLLAVPMAGGMAMTVVVLLPSLLASLVRHAHHCTSHAGHPHLCLVHLPHETSLLGWLLLSVTTVIVIWKVRPLAAEILRARGLLRALPALNAGTVTTLASMEPICAAVGWLSPRVVVSRGFAAGVGVVGMRAAIAHEQAHARRRDALWSFVARMAAIALPHSVALEILAALDLATERACDELAAVEVGDRMAVADAILRSQRLGARPMQGPCAAFGPSHWSLRVEALLRPLADPPTGWRRWDRLAAVAAMACIASSGELHHVAETALAVLAH